VTYFVQNIQRHLCDHAQLSLLCDAYAGGFGYGLLLAPSPARRSLRHLDVRVFISADIWFTRVTPVERLLFGSCTAATGHGSSSRGGGGEQRSSASITLAYCLGHQLMGVTGFSHNHHAKDIIAIHKAPWSKLWHPSVSQLPMNIE